MTTDAAFRHRIAATPLLTATEERALSRRACAGDAAARDRLVEANLRLVVHMARGLHRPGGPIPLMELVQEGTVGLIRAVDGFDPERGTRLSTYATWWIREALHRALDDNGHIVRIPREVRARARADGTALTHASLDSVGIDTLVDADADADADAGDAVERVVAADDGRDVRRLLGTLRPLERRVLERRYGLDGGREATTAQVAAELSTTPAKLRLVEDLALRRMRAGATTRPSPPRR